LATYKRPYTPDRIILNDEYDADEDMMTAEEDLAARVAKFPAGPLIPVQDDLSAPAQPGDESAEQLMAENNVAAGQEPEIDITTEPADIAARLNQIQKEMATVKFPARRKREDGVDLTADIDDLKSRLAALDREQDSAEKDIEKRQLYSELAAQLGKFAAAIYGQKTGIDLAGLKPEAPKFDNEYELLLAKYKGQKADVRDVAEAGMRDKVRQADRLDKEVGAQEEYDLNKFRAEEAARLQGLGTEARGLLTAENLRTRREIAKAREAEKAALAVDKAALKREEQYAKLAQQINNVYKGKETGTVKAAKAMAILQTNPLTKSIDKKEWEDALQEDGMLWGKNPKKADEALASITQKLSELAVANTSSATAAAAASGQSTPPVKSSPAPAGMVKIIAPNGAEKLVPESMLKAALAAGAKRAE
jgi:hypothetical protein